MRAYYPDTDGRAFSGGPRRFRPYRFGLGGGQQDRHMHGVFGGYRPAIVEPVVVE